jgi:hypothetical protein
MAINPGAAIPSTTPTPAPTASNTALVPVTYKTVGGTGLNTGYLSDLSTGQTLYTALDRAVTVTIGSAAGNAIASSFAPSAPYLISTQSIAAPFACATVGAFTQPAVGSVVTVTVSNLDTVLGSEAQYAIGTDIFLTDVAGVTVGGRYIIRGGVYPSLSIELQNPLLNNLATGQNAIVSGGAVPQMKMAAIAKLLPPTGATHAYLSITQSSRAIISAVRYANSEDAILRMQSIRDQIQLKRTVAISTKPASLHIDRGPKRILAGDSTVKLGPDDIWIYGLTDVDAAQCSVEWMGGY